jgi:hypothetical protein
MTAKALATLQNVDAGMQRAGSGQDGSSRAFGQSVPALPLLFIGSPGDATARGEIELTAAFAAAARVQENDNESNDFR